LIRVPIDSAHSASKKSSKIRCAQLEKSAFVADAPFSSSKGNGAPTKPFFDLKFDFVRISGFRISI
jgi:hypothetical protein